jgi:hypothetical protein
MFAISVIAIPILGGLSIKADVDKGVDIWEFGSLCE